MAKKMDPMLLDVPVLAPNVVDAAPLLAVDDAGVSASPAAAPMMTHAVMYSTRTAVCAFCICANVASSMSRGTGPPPPPRWYVFAAVAGTWVVRAASTSGGDDDDDDAAYLLCDCDHDGA
jgi:hypothetical protein